jgi:hypothetical protein
MPADLKFAFRQPRQHPGFTLTALLSLLLAGLGNGRASLGTKLPATRPRPRVFAGWARMPAHHPFAPVLP